MTCSKELDIYPVPTLSKSLTKLWDHELNSEQPSLTHTTL